MFSHCNAAARRSTRVGFALAAVMCSALVAAAAGPKIVACHLGLGGQVRLGCWAPLRIDVEGGDEPLAVQVVAIAPDADGLGVATTAPRGRPLSTEPGRTSSDRLFVRPGKQNASLTIELFAAGRRIERRVFEVETGDPAGVKGGTELPFSTPAEARLVVTLGPDAGFGVAAESPAADRAPRRNSWSDTLPTVARIATIDDLPRDALGYDGASVVTLAVGAKGAQGWLAGLTPDDARVRALVEWVESGGRLVLSCGAGGPELLGPGGALEALAPGRFAGLGSLARTTRLEEFAAAERPIDLRGGTLAVAKLEDVTGTVDVAEGSGERGLPLVVRSLRGFGEVTFVTIDLDSPTIASWEGRGALCERLLSSANPAAPDDDDADGDAAWYAGDDLLSTILQRLDNSFIGVTTTPLGTVVALVIGYLLLIGPLDYWFTHKVLRRPEATWVTFPLAVVATSVAAYAAGHYLKGDELRVNQFEVIDVDAESGVTRGALVSHVFSPRAERYDLRLVPRDATGATLKPQRSWASWLAEPGRQLGGMQRSMTAGLVPAIDYTVEGGGVRRAEGAVIRGLPIPVWSTKTVTGCWVGQGRAGIEWSLVRTDDGLVEGTLNNVSGRDWKACQLVYGDWAWRLKALGDKQTVRIESSTPPVRVNTLLRALNRSRRQGTEGADVATLAPLLTLGGKLDSSADSPRSRYLTNLDLTHALDNGRAVLLVEATGGEPSRLEIVGRAEASPKDRVWVFCRYLLEVDRNDPTLGDPSID
ncbi:MAG: hypothetical protein ACRCT8_10440 [Lacipirellulaceae bacterium]